MKQMTTEAVFIYQACFAAFAGFKFFVGFLLVRKIEKL